jgi:hypothetical protein
MKAVQFMHGGATCNGHGVLVPFDKREGMTPQQAAGVAGKSETTILRWCRDWGLGRRVGGGVWVVSRVALAMHLDGDRKALAAYHSGDRSSELVAQYFRRLDLATLLVSAKPAFSARAALSAS